MRTRSTLLTLALLSAACGGTTAATTTSVSLPDSTEPPATTAQPAPTTTEDEPVETTTSEPTGGGGQLALTSLSFGDASMVVITNVGDEAVSLGGHFLCQRPSYHGLEDVELPPGQSYAISTGGSVFLPPPGAIVATKTAGIGVLRPGSGEVGLYSSANFGSSADILSYVEWGNEGHGRSDTARSAGIWSGFVPTDDATTGILASTVPALAATHWEAHSG